MCLAASSENKTKRNKAINFWIQVFRMYVGCTTQTLFTSVCVCAACANTHYICWINFHCSSMHVCVLACMCWSVIFYAMNISTNVLLLFFFFFFFLFVVIVGCCFVVSSNQDFQLHTKSNLCMPTENKNDWDECTKHWSLKKNRGKKEQALARKKRDREIELYAIHNIRWTNE